MFLPTTKDEVKDELTMLLKDLRLNSDEKMWKEFSLMFDETQSEFYKRLTDKFPDLTQADLKLCAFLRLNMSTKDISELTGHQISSIENARYRLRKKLHLTNSLTNLVAFLIKI